MNERNAIDTKRDFEGVSRLGRVVLDLPLALWLRCTEVGARAASHCEGSAWLAGVGGLPCLPLSAARAAPARRRLRATP